MTIKKDDSYLDCKDEDRVTPFALEMAQMDYYNFFFTEDVMILRIDSTKKAI